MSLYVSLIYDKNNIKLYIENNSVIDKINKNKRSVNL